MNSAFCVAVHALICLNRRQEQLSSEELARSICTNPARVRKIMAGLKREGKSILFISHKLNEIMAVSDRVTVLRKG